MGAVQYLPASEVSKVVSFVQFASPQGTTTLLQTALNTAFGTQAGNIQCFADTTSGQTSNAVVVSGDTAVLSVAPNNWVSFINGQWVQLTPSQIAAQYTQYFTS